MDDFIANMIQGEFEKMYSSLIQEHPDRTEEILKLLFRINIEISKQKISKTKDPVQNKINNDICQARIYKNGYECQCSRPKLSRDLCTRHSNKLLYGRITEEIPSDQVSKFNKFMNQQITKNVEEKSINTEEEPLPLKKISRELDINKILLSQNKYNLQKIIFNSKKYYFDKYNKCVYTYSDTPKYIGTFNGNCILR